MVTTVLSGAVTGVHTNNIESYWARSKAKIKRMKGIHRELLTSYLDEFIRWGKTVDQMFDSVSQDIATQHPLL